MPSIITSLELKGSGDSEKLAAIALRKWNG